MDRPIRKWLKKNIAEESTKPTSDINQSREEDGDNVGHAGTVDVTSASVNVRVIRIDKHTPVI